MGENTINLLMAVVGSGLAGSLVTMIARRKVLEAEARKVRGETDTDYVESTMGIAKFHRETAIRLQDRVDELSQNLKTLNEELVTSWNEIAAAQVVNKQMTLENNGLTQDVGALGDIVVNLRAINKKLRYELDEAGGIGNDHLAYYADRTTKDVEKLERRGVLRKSVEVSG